MNHNRYKQLKRITCFSPLGNLLIKKNASEKQYKLFAKIKTNYEVNTKYCMNFTGVYKRIKNIQFDSYIYYIPDDVYNYIRYDNQKIYQITPVPSELKEKVENCSRFLEIELTYLLLIKRCNFSDNPIIKKSFSRPFRPTIKIEKSFDNRISIYERYEEIENNEYIARYDEFMRKEIKMIEESNYIRI